MNSNELFKYDLLVLGPTFFFKITSITNCMHKKTTGNNYGFVYSFNNNVAFHRVCIFNNLTMYGKYVLQQLLSFIHNLQERICGQHTYTIRLLPQLKKMFFINLSRSRPKFQYVVWIQTNVCHHIKTIIPIVYYSTATKMRISREHVWQ